MICEQWSFQLHFSAVLPGGCHPGAQRQFRPGAGHCPEHCAAPPGAHLGHQRSGCEYLPGGAACCLEMKNENEEYRPSNFCRAKSLPCVKGGGPALRGPAKAQRKRVWWGEEVRRRERDLPRLSGARRGILSPHRRIGGVDGKRADNSFFTAFHTSIRAHRKRRCRTKLVCIAFFCVQFQPPK